MEAQCIAHCTVRHWTLFINAACSQLLMAYGWMELWKFRPRNRTIYCNFCKRLCGHQGDLRILRNYWLLNYVSLHLISSAGSRTVRAYGWPFHCGPGAGPCRYGLQNVCHLTSVKLNKSNSPIGDWYGCGAVLFFIHCSIRSRDLGHAPFVP